MTNPVAMLNDAFRRAAGPGWVTTPGVRAQIDDSSATGMRWSEVGQSVDIAA